MPLIATRGAASAQGFGEFAQSAAPVYVEDVFSTYLYSGNNSSQTITNGIDLSTKGGMVWLKSRTNTEVHQLWDTVRGASKNINSNSTSQEFNQSPDGVNAFNTNGFSINSAGTSWNQSGQKYVSWTFREQAKFFDIVAWTGNGVNGRVINHNLTSTPGCVMIKRLDTTSNWIVSHRSAVFNLWLNSTNDLNSGNNQLDGFVNNSSFTSSSFTLSGGGSGINNVNASGGTYVAYVFAHDAGGFGLTGADNVISCGSFTTSGTAPNNATVNLGYEPQFLLYKISSSTGDWRIVDNMRGFTASGGTPTSPQLRPNSTSIEQNNSFVQLTSTGFTTDTGVTAETYIYIAIRRGPMKTPTSGTSVFQTAIATGSGVAATITGGTTPTDTVLYLSRTGAHYNMFLDRMRGSPYLWPAGTDADTTPSNLYWDVMDGYRTDSNYGNYADSDVREFLKRAPGFFDVVCYTGTGVTAWINHNLTVVPELIILKNRTVSSGWLTYAAPLGADKYLQVNSTAGSTTSTIVWDNTTPTSTQFRVYNGFNNSGYNYVGYLFASCPGVSKVGSYSGTGGTQTISCGFAARFVLIKRTDSTGSWWVWDTARGMVAGTDPRLALNSTAAETNADWVYTNASGFQIVTTDATVNASGGSYIYLAIA